MLRTSHAWKRFDNIEQIRSRLHRHTIHFYTLLRFLSGQALAFTNLQSLESPGVLKLTLQ